MKNIYTLFILLGFFATTKAQESSAVYDNLPSSNTEGFFIPPTESSSLWAPDTLHDGNWNWNQSERTISIVVEDTFYLTNMEIALYLQLSEGAYFNAMPPIGMSSYLNHACSNNNQYWGVGIIELNGHTNMPIAAEGQIGIYSIDLYRFEDNDEQLAHLSSYNVLYPGENTLVYSIFPRYNNNEDYFIDDVYSMRLLNNRDNTPAIKLTGYYACDKLEITLCAEEQNHAFGYEEVAQISVTDAYYNTGNLTYEWSTGETDSRIYVNPEETTTYSVTATDERGCTDIAEHTVNVYDVRDGDKVIMTQDGKEKSVKLEDVQSKLTSKKETWTLGKAAMSAIDFEGGGCNPTENFLDFFASPSNTYQDCGSLFDNLEQENSDEFYLKPGQNGSVWNSTSASYSSMKSTVTFSDPFKIDQVNIPVYFFRLGNREMPRLVLSLDIWDEATNQSLSITFPEQVSENINRNGIGIYQFTNPVFSYSTVCNNNSLEFPAGTYTVSYSLAANSLPRRTELFKLAYKDGSIPVEIFGCSTKDCGNFAAELCEESQNLALGYHQSAKIEITNVVDAVGNVEYVWNTGDNTPSINVSPKNTTSYICKITDERGCKDEVRHTVIVRDISIPGDEDKVVMTHKGDHEHKVKAKDVAKKLNDKKGEWTLGTLVMQEIDFSGGNCADEDRYKTDFEEEDVFSLEDEFKLNAYPNPVRNTLMLESEVKLYGNVKLYDLFGALLDEKEADGVWEVNLDFTHLRKGFYTVIYQSDEGEVSTYKILKN